MTLLLTEWIKVYMVCNRHDQQWYNNSDATWIFERTGGAESIEEYKGSVKVKNIGAGTYLASILVSSENMWWVSLRGWKAHPHEDMRWNVRRDPGNKNHLQLEKQTRFIAQDLSGSESKPYSIPLFEIQ